MPKFTFLEKEGYIPVAKIVSQDNLNGEILFLDPSFQSNDDSDSFNFDKQAVNYKKYMKNMTAKDMNKKSAVVSKYLQKGKEPEDPEIKSIYKNIMKDGSKDIILKNVIAQLIGWHQLYEVVSLIIEVAIFDGCCFCISIRFISNRFICCSLLYCISNYFSVSRTIWNCR